MSYGNNPLSGASSKKNAYAARTKAGLVVYL